jgi:hypothetical protein
MVLDEGDGVRQPFVLLLSSADGILLNLHCAAARETQKKLFYNGVSGIGMDAA